jgi:hypothetical protein
MIKSCSNNDIVNNENRKSKQLTLFDLKSKSITVNINKENSKPSSDSEDEIILCESDDNIKTKTNKKISTSNSDNKITEKKE